METVRAKFYVNWVQKHASGSTQVCLNAVSRGEDNKSWSKYTPSGEIKMTILNEVAAEFFEPGNEYFVTFSSAPKGQEGMNA